MDRYRGGDDPERKRRGNRVRPVEQPKPPKLDIGALSLKALRDATAPEPKQADEKVDPKDIERHAE
jgi:hypothetical protein